VSGSRIKLGTCCLQSRSLPWETKLHAHKATGSVRIVPHLSQERFLPNPFQFVGLEVLIAVDMKSTVFWVITRCSPLKVNWRFGGQNNHNFRVEGGLAAAFTLVSCSAYSSILKMETICSSETSLDFQRTTQRYNPEGRNFPICELSIILLFNAF
jgi:hypothetical protein